MINRKIKKSSTFRTLEVIRLPSIQRSQKSKSPEPRIDPHNNESGDIQKTRSMPAQLIIKKDLKRTSVLTRRETLAHSHLMAPISMRKRVSQKQLPPLHESTSDGTDVTSINQFKNTNQTTELVFDASDQVKKSINRIKNLIKKCKDNN
ncbi:unnamed protein product [Blepharisma stoltei]|uniref:Uncharacterized protein n=1 Tax=Blepharisma stoltei TaxID=1481888 RepID=A0AAU9JHQ2_9CILI|nr:unnamed protein product [Blepharisma stoltei]